jgi:hypothetical protein
MNGYNAKSSLDAELLEECGDIDAWAGNVGVGIEEGDAEYAHGDDKESSADALAIIPDGPTPENGP